MKSEFLKTLQRFGKIQWNGIMCGLTKGEFRILYAIAAENEKAEGKKGIYVSALAMKLQATMPNVSRMLKNLESQNLIGRSVDENNRRKTLVYLTEEGIKRKQESEKELDSFTEEVLKRMGKENMEELLKLWNRIADVSEEIMKEKEGDR